jgi:hypothetical protein
MAEAFTGQVSGLPGQAHREGTSLSRAIHRSQALLRDFLRGRIFRLYTVLGFDSRRRTAMGRRHGVRRKAAHRHTLSRSERLSIFIALGTLLLVGIGVAQLIVGVGQLVVGIEALPAGSPAVSASASSSPSRSDAPYDSTVPAGTMIAPVGGDLHWWYDHVRSTGR